MAAELLNFRYKGIALGKYVEGDIEALNDNEAAHKLKDQKIIITKLTKEKKKAVATKSKKKGKGFTFGTGVAAKDILVFSAKVLSTKKNVWPKWFLAETFFPPKTFSPIGERQKGKVF